MCIMVKNQTSLILINSDIFPFYLKQKVTIWYPIFIITNTHFHQVTRMKPKGP